MIYIGTPHFAIPALRALIDHGYIVISVITQPDRPKGRSRKPVASPVKKMAIEHQIELFQPEKISDDSFCEVIRQQEPDIIIAVAFGQLLRKNLLSIPRWGVINIHGSLLPQYRGAAPIQRVIMNNESITGLTIMHMDEGLDSGPILFQEEVLILEDETAGQLHDRLSLLSGELMIRSLDRMINESVHEVPQDDTKATYADKIDPNMAKIDWNQDAMKIVSHIRGLDPSPGANTVMNDVRVKLFSARVLDDSCTGLVPGKVKRQVSEGFGVETAKGIVQVREIQYPGKRRMLCSDFLRGYDLAEGSILGKTI